MVGVYGYDVDTVCETIFNYRGLVLPGAVADEGNEAASTEVFRSNPVFGFGYLEQFLIAVTADGDYHSATYGELIDKLLRSSSTAQA